MSNPGSRYVRLLQQTKGQNLNNGTVAGGLAHALTQGLRGYASRKADEEEQEKARQREQQIAGYLTGVNQRAMGNDGPTQEAAARAPIPDPAGLASMFADRNMAPFAAAEYGRMMAPAPERKMVQGVDGKMYYPDTGEPVLPGVQKPEEAYNLSPGQQRFVGNQLVASVPAAQDAPPGYRMIDGKMEIIPGGPADPNTLSAQAAARASNLIPIPGIGLYNKDTAQFVNPGQSAPPLTEPGPQFAPVANPAANMAPSVAAKVTEAEAKATNAELTKMRDGIQPVVDVMKMAERFEELMKVQDTGGFLRKLPGAGTVEGIYDAEAGEMQSLTDKITPLMRNGFPGAASDSDRRMFRGAAFGLDKLPEVNRNIILGMKTSAQIAQDRLAFMETYASAQGGTLRGANEQWQKYLNDNPIFDPNGNPSAPTLNTDRQSWREYFTPKKTGQNAKPLSAAEREEYDRLRRELAQ